MTVDFGYDQHSISIDEAVFAQIQVGLPVVVEGQGLPVEGVRERDFWAFNHGVPGTIYMSTDEGRDMFEGGLGDAEVTVHRD